MLPLSGPGDMATAQLFRQDSGAFPGGLAHILRTGSHSEAFYHDDKPAPQAGPQQLSGRHRLANSFGQADFAKMFKEDAGGKQDGGSRLDLASQHSGELHLADGSRQQPPALGPGGQGSSAAPPLFETGVRCSIQISAAAAGSPLAGSRPSPRFTAGKLEAATSGELRSAFSASGDFGRALLNSDSFGRRGSLGLTGTFGGDSPIASTVPMPAMLQRAHFEAARGQLLADAEGGAMSPLSPGGPASCRRLQELYGFFQTGGPLGRTNTEGQDDLLAQVAHDASSGDFDLGDPSELRQLLPAVEGAVGGGPPPSPISAPVPMSLSMQHHPAAPAIAAPSASLAPPVPAVQIVLANNDPADQQLPPTPPLLRMPTCFPLSPCHRQLSGPAPPSPNRRQPSLPGDMVGAPAALHPLQAGRGARRASDPAPPAGVTKRTSSGGGGGGPHASAGALAAEAEAGRAAAAAAATCGASADEGAAPKIKPKREGRRPRRMTCNYCRTHVTPQWRCGPDGPRTLCNACGVRWGKGKLEIRETAAVNVLA